MQANLMEDRGCGALHRHLEDCRRATIHQHGRELDCCQATGGIHEFDFFLHRQKRSGPGDGSDRSGSRSSGGSSGILMGNDGSRDLFVDDHEFNRPSLVSHEYSNCLWRTFLPCCRPYRLKISTAVEHNELIVLDRPARCHTSCCKCCCRQTATLSNGDTEVGFIEEEFWYCVPSYLLLDSSRRPVYRVHPPTCCCGGMFVNQCADGTPCCYRVQSLRIYPVTQSDTNLDAPYVGCITKEPKTLVMDMIRSEIRCEFPSDANSFGKAMVLASAIFLDTNIFQVKEDSQISC